MKICEEQRKSILLRQAMREDFEKFVFEWCAKYELPKKIGIILACTMSACVMSDAPSCEHKDNFDCSKL